MVVVSGSWGKNAYPTPAPASDDDQDDMVISSPNNSNNNNNKMSAKAVLMCRPNSHPFHERTLVLDHRVKIGRSVARVRATPTNAIFDCKVLSRHHAVLWYDSGKFYLQDTKSSNGTFVNNNRLSSSGTEAQEVCSGDIVQFGVDVLENNRKITHNCIVATLKLYLPDGKEAKASLSIPETSRHALDELYKLNQIIQEASQREQCLENKLSILQHLVEETRKSTQETWQAYIGEERLLSQVATLEGQLAQANKNLSDEKLRDELNKLHEEKLAYQVAAKEALSKLHAERLEAVAMATEQKRFRTTAEQETILAKEQLAQALQELNDVAEKLSSEQQKAEEERIVREQSLREIQARLDLEMQIANELRAQLPSKQEEIEKCTDDCKSIDDMLGENDTCDNDDLDNSQSNTNNVSPTQQNHINLTVAPALDCSTNEDSLEETFDTVQEQTGSATLVRDYTIIDEDVTDNIYKDIISKMEELKLWDIEDEKGEPKTIKHQFQSIQSNVLKQLMELKRISDANKVRILAMEGDLEEQKSLVSEKCEEATRLRTKLVYMEQTFKENCNEIQQLKDKILGLSKELNAKENISNDSTNSDRIEALEEELVTLKERFVSVNDEKLKLNKSLLGVREQYDALRNRSSNITFFYIAPLVLMILYLLISQNFS